MPNNTSGLQPGVYQFSYEDRVKGAKAAAKTKSIRCTIKKLLAMPMGEGKTIDLEKIKAFKKLVDENGEPKNMTVAEMLAFRLMFDALNGDRYAMEKILTVADVFAESPDEKSEKSDNNLIDVLSQASEGVKPDAIPELQ